jgi:hypothetical protein
LRAPPAKLHQDPPFPATPYLPAAPRVALLSRTRSNTRLSPVVFHFTATCPIARPTSSQITSTSFSCHAYPHRCAPFAIPVIPVVTVPPPFPSRARHHRVQLQPLLRDQTRPSVRPLLAFRSTTPQEGWEQVLLDLPKGEGAPGFALNPKSLNIAAALRLWSLCTATNHYTMLFPVV